MNKSQDFFNHHLLQYSAKKSGLGEGIIVRLANIAANIGGFSYTESLKKIAVEDIELLKKLINELNISDDEEENIEVVDEGGIGHHDNKAFVTQNPTHELSSITEYAPLSIPAGIPG